MSVSPGSCYCEMSWWWQAAAALILVLLSCLCVKLPGAQLLRLALITSSLAGADCRTGSEFPRPDPWPGRQLLCVVRSGGPFQNSQAHCDDTGKRGMASSARSE